MSATVAAPQGDTSTAHPLCSPEALDALKQAFEAFVADPMTGSAWTRLQQAVEDLSPGDENFSRDLGVARQHQRQRHGCFRQRYVLSKDVAPDGSLRTLPRPIPVRDDTSNKIARVVGQNPAAFPGGLQQLLNAERPLQQARSADYATLIANTVRVELDSLLKCDRMKLLKSGATVLDLADAYRHLKKVASAHPKVIETLDQNDTTAIIEFLVTVACRTPLSQTELVRFVTQAAESWQQADGRDEIIRGRVIQSGLQGKAPLLKSWVEPFAAEVIYRGWEAELETAFRKRVDAEARAAAPRTPPAPKPATNGAFSAPLRPAAVTPPPPKPAPSLSDTAPLDVSSTDAFKIPIGVPEPERLQVLRNYLRVASAATVIRLSEAMRMAAAREDVVGHRQYVQQVFHEERWAIVGQTKGDPMFSRLNTRNTAAGG